jgi:hypothetical protein
MSVFRPDDICGAMFKTTKVKVMMDTSAVSDWNEIDYVKIVGSTQMPKGVLRPGLVDLVYRPDANFFGEDSFKISATDCAFRVERFVESDKEAKLFVSADSGDAVQLLTGSVVLNTEGDYCATLEAFDVDHVPARSDTVTFTSSFIGQGLTVSGDGRLCSDGSKDLKTSFQFSACGTLQVCSDFNVDVEVRGAGAKKSEGPPSIIYVVIGVVPCLLAAAAITFIVRRSRKQRLNLTHQITKVRVCEERSDEARCEFHGDLLRLSLILF